MAGTGKAHLRGADAILRAEEIVVEFPATHRSIVHAVSGISIDVLRGETLGLVGESGCGKSTLGRALVQLIRPTSGSVYFGDTDLTKLDGEKLRRTRSRLQMIFQDPISSLNPWRRIADIVAEPLAIWGRGTKLERAARVHDVLATVGLDPDVVANRRPAELSGGQCQRVSIARALMLDPEILICDEPVSALDVSVQGQVLNLLEDMKDRYGLTIIFVAHDLAVIKAISDRVAVMYLGKLCEVAPSSDFYTTPLHPYTTLLLAAIPQPDRRTTASNLELNTELPSPINPPSGCRFRTRCPRAQDLCAEQEPTLRELLPNHYVACHFPNQGTTAGFHPSVPSLNDVPPKQ